MMDKKFWISAIVAIVLTFALGFVVHGVILAGDYQALMGTLFRKDEDGDGAFPLYGHRAYHYGVWRGLDLPAGS